MPMKITHLRIRDETLETWLILELANLHPPNFTILAPNSNEETRKCNAHAMLPNGVQEENPLEATASFHMPFADTKSKLVLVGRLKHLADAARGWAYAVHKSLVVLALAVFGPAHATFFVVHAHGRTHIA